MQLTIEIPDELAEKAESERERLIELIHRTLRQPTSGKMGVIQEVFHFLGRRPSPEEILAFRPSAPTVERLGDLLNKNRESSLTLEVDLRRFYVLRFVEPFLRVQTFRFFHAPAQFNLDEPHQKLVPKNAS